MLTAVVELDSRVVMTKWKLSQEAVSCSAEITSLISDNALLSR